MTALRKLRRKPRGTYHVKWPRMKHVENSVRGILYAIAHWYARIDIDMSITKADPQCPRIFHPDGKPCRGHIVGCHWPKPMRKDGFRDPLRKLHRDTLIRQMTLLEALRLVARGGYRIRLIDDLLRACAGKHPGWKRRGPGSIIALLEPKGDLRFEQDWPWQHIKTVAAKYGTRVEVYALPANSEALPFARAAGFNARTIR